MVFADRIQGTDNAMCSLTWKDTRRFFDPAKERSYAMATAAPTSKAQNLKSLQTMNLRVFKADVYFYFDVGIIFGRQWRVWHPRLLVGGGDAARCNSNHSPTPERLNPVIEMTWQQKEVFFSLQRFLPVSSGVKKGHAKRRSATARVKSYPCKIPKGDPLLQCSNPEEVSLRLAFA